MSVQISHNANGFGPGHVLVFMFFCAVSFDVGW